MAAIPNEIIGSVMVMGDKTKPASVAAPLKNAAPAQPKVTASVSPFLGDTPPAKEAVSSPVSPSVPSLTHTKVSVKTEHAMKTLPVVSDKMTSDSRPKASHFSSMVVPEIPSLPASEPLALADSEFVRMSRWKKIVLGLGIVIFLGSFAALGWWYYTKYIRATGTEVIPAPVMPQPNQTPVSPVVPATPYSADNPNYLSVNTETVNAAELKKLLSEAGSRMVDAQMVRPVEFLLTDKNNNPIAFSRFAYLIDLGVSKELLAVIDESFSLYLYNNGGKVVSGLGLTMSDEATGSALIKKIETSLPNYFRVFLYDGVTVPPKAAFRSGLYNNEPVRYVNIDSTNNVSFDYVIRGKQWFIGASKDTLRAIIDKKH